MSAVAPYAGAWIETHIEAFVFLFSLSPLMQGRGLKQIQSVAVIMKIGVAPYAGAWIETLRKHRTVPYMVVAPYAGAWIETRCTLTMY